MNREETRKAAEVMLHYANGGEVQIINCDGTGYQDYPDSGRIEPVWNWQMPDKYRIKPQPVEVTCYLVLCNGQHDGYFATATAACLRCHDIRGLGKNAVMVELKGTYTCDT